MYFIFMERSAHVLFLQSCAAAIDSIREKSKHKFIQTRAELESKPEIVCTMEPQYYESSVVRFRIFPHRSQSANIKVHIPVLAQFSSHDLTSIFKTPVCSSFNQSPSSTKLVIYFSVHSLPFMVAMAVSVLSLFLFIIIVVIFITYYQKLMCLTISIQSLCLVFTAIIQ